MVGLAFPVEESNKEKKENMNTNRSVGTSEANQVRRNSGIEMMEQALQRGIAAHAAPLHYDDLVVLNQVGAVKQSKVKAVRISTGQIDIAKTFQRAGINTLKENKIERWF